MPVYTNDHQEVRHTDDMQDIITKVPSWLLRWGITLFFFVLLLLVVLSAFIRYPDVINTQLQIFSPNAPKPIVAKVSGTLAKLLVTNNQMVTSGQPLGYMESTANHTKVLDLLVTLKKIQQYVLNNKLLNTEPLNQEDDVRLGELQSSYQIFFAEYLSYISSVNNGFLLTKKSYLQKDLIYLGKQQQQLFTEKNIEQRDLALAQQEFEMHKKLEEGHVETLAEFRQEESKYLAKKSPLVQTETSIISGNNNFISKEKDILELDNQLKEEKSKFLQAVNTLISAVEEWKSKYILSASLAGKVSFAGIIQEQQVLTLNQQVFYINPGNEQFFGEMQISQNSLGKVKIGQQVLVKLKSYPYEEFGMLKGTIEYIADVPYKDSIFVSKVNFKIKKSSDLKQPVHLKSGMLADAEIITQDGTILQRISRSLFKFTH